MTQEQIKAKAKEQFPNDEFRQQAVIDAINWATKELEKENAELKNQLNKVCGIKGCMQLTKAKDLLLKLSTCLEGHSNNNFEYELIKDTEQFLNSEVKK